MNRSRAILAVLVLVAVAAAGCIASIGGGPPLPDTAPPDRFAGARFEIANFTATPEGDGYEDDRVHVQFVVVNKGNATATRFATLRFAGEVIDVLNATLAPGAHTRTHRYAIVPGSAGVHAIELAVGERHATVEFTLAPRPRAGDTVALGASGLQATVHAFEPAGGDWRLNVTLAARAGGTTERLVARAICGVGPDDYREGPGIWLSWPGAGDSLTTVAHLRGCAGGVVGLHIHYLSAAGDGFVRFLAAPPG